jgi:UDP-N-acetylmuramoyl-L-alanyl-D-glutamate--2,6-diaminopimelate ligase
VNAVPAFLEPVIETRWDEALAGALGQWLRARLHPEAALVADSRAVRPGDAFLAWPGRQVDGRTFIADAIARGAVAVLHEAGDAMPTMVDGVGALPVPGLAALAGPIAAAFHGRAVDRLRVVAITGTNGKTSVSHWVARGLAAPGRPSAVVGTLGAGLQADALPIEPDSGGLTTPDALALQRALAGFVARGARSVAMEASSIGLDQLRLNGTPIEVAAFTNLSRDHLDYHGSMEAYAQSKARLFAWPTLRAVAVNGDDPMSPQFLAALDAVHRPAPVLRIVHGEAPGSHGARGDAVLIAERIVEDASGIALSLGGDFGRADLRLALLGRFNVANALSTAACWLGLGMAFSDVVERLSRLEPVVGRMQRLGHPGGPLAVIDYAHTPDALAGALEALRPVAMARGGALWCVFGAGGDRDAGKRPLMGHVAQRGADRLVITSDNPRSEHPFRIASDIRAGLIREPYATELDRARAIDLAIASAGRDDVILIAGKGHERTQEVGGQRLPFSDLEHAARVLDRRAREETGLRDAELAARIPDV